MLQGARKKNNYVRTREIVDMARGNARLSLSLPQSVHSCRSSMDSPPPSKRRRRVVLTDDGEGGVGC